MNNSQFRKLVLDTPARLPSSTSPSTTKSQNGVQSTPSLGSRLRSSIPMTPRALAGYSGTNEFARQLAERNSSSSTQKKFKSSAAPKGAKLPSGYVDRAKEREGGEEEEEDDKVKRVNALEEMVKLGQIDEPTFVKLRDDILGDGVGMERAKLVKGLDWRLLERARKGEVGALDVLEGTKGRDGDGEEREIGDKDVDEELDKLEDREVTAVVKDQVVKKGEMAPPELTGKKRTRDQILAELKAARQAAKEAAQPSLGSKFKKVGEARNQSRIERDSKGREVLITVDAHGNEKRKVRKVPIIELEGDKTKGLLMPDKDAKPLGMEVPEVLKVPEEDEADIDIFDDVGDDYDPLAGLEDDSDKSEEEVGEQAEEDTAVEVDRQDKPKQDKDAMPPPPRPQQQQSRNYFGKSGEAAVTTGDSTSQQKALSDPTILAALKKASNLNLATKEPENAEEAAREAKRRKMLQIDDRDAQDMDLGFGGSRFGDEEDTEEKRVKLSAWGGGDEGGEGKGEGNKKRKRGPKKRKGDGDNPADVLKVLERRKEASS